MSDEEKSGGGGGNVAATIGAVAGAAGGGAFMYNRESNALINAARKGEEAAPEALRNAVGTVLDADNKKLRKQSNAVDHLGHEGSVVDGITITKKTAKPVEPAAPAAVETASGAATAGAENTAEHAATTAAAEAKPAGYKVLFEGKSGITGNQGRVELHVKEIDPKLAEAMGNESTHSVQGEALADVTKAGGWKNRVVKAAAKDLNKELRDNPVIKESGSMWSHMKWGGGRGKVIGTAAAGALALGGGAKLLLGGKSHTETIDSSRDAGTQEPAR